MKYVKIYRTTGISGNTSSLHYHKFRYRDATWSMAQCVIYLFIYSQMLLKMAMACLPILDLFMPVELLDVRVWLEGQGGRFPFLGLSCKQLHYL